MQIGFRRPDNRDIDWLRIRSQQRLLQMVGWNPIPFAQQTLGKGKLRTALETHLVCESSLLPRAKGVFIFPVDLNEEQGTGGRIHGFGRI